MNRLRTFLRIRKCITDLIVFHGLSRLNSIAPLLEKMISSYGINIDIVYTERNQESTETLLNTVDSTMNITMLQLYQNRIEKLVERLNIDGDWAAELSQHKSAYFIKTHTGTDYVYMDDIL